MELLVSFLWIIIGYFVFCYKYGESKLGGSIPLTLFLLLYPCGLLLYGAFLNLFEDPALISLCGSHAFLLLLLIHVMFNPSSDDVYLAGIISGVSAYVYHLSLHYRCDNLEFIAFMGMAFSPYIVGISITYLYTRKIYRNQKKNKQLNQ